MEYLQTLLLDTLCTFHSGQTYKVSLNNTYMNEKLGTEIQALQLIIGRNGKWTFKLFKFQGISPCYATSQLLLSLFSASHFLEQLPSPLLSSLATCLEWNMYLQLFSWKISEGQMSCCFTRCIASQFCQLRLLPSQPTMWPNSANVCSVPAVTIIALVDHTMCQALC